MLLKKFALIGSALAISALPVLANADLITCNHTSLPSTAKIISSPLPVKPCSRKTDGSGVTKPGECLTTTTLNVRIICGSKSKGSCTADVYASDNCTGTNVATVSIDLGTMNVTVLREDPHYHIQPAGSTVNIYQR